jgi:histone deacetylase complex regulatory component SIN3
MLKYNSDIIQPIRYIRDVGKVGLIPNKPRYFNIEFKDKMYKYESDSAEEIVAKVTYLLQMKP